MNEDLEFIQSVIKEEIKTWTGYQRQIVNGLGEEEFAKEISKEVLEYIDIEYEISLEYMYEEDKLKKERILEVLDDLMTDRLFPF